MQYRRTSKTTSRHDAFEGVKIHKPNYGIVIDDVAIAELDLEDSKIIEILEAANNFQSGIITKVTLLHKNNSPAQRSMIP